MKNFGLMLNLGNDIYKTVPFNELFRLKGFLSYNRSHQFTLIRRRKILFGVDAPEEVI